MSQEAVALLEPPPAGISDQERRWAILRWLSLKLGDAPHGDTLEAAERFEEFLAQRVAGRKRSKEAPSKIGNPKIEKFETIARRIVFTAADAEMSFEELGPAKLRKPNRISRNPPRWLHKR
ncbi:MAG: hypothetical protein IH905_17745 [Proteobacteria bacterium]|nr:hypothetical protein [Pseudomonadota bacterium]